MTLPNIVTNRITGVHPLNYGDVTPLAQLNSEYIAFTVRPDSPIGSGREFIAQLRQNPGALSIAFSNIGSANHIGAAVLFKAAGLDVKKAKLVAFKGASEAVTALMGGHVDAIASSASTVLSQVQSGQLRPIAVAAPKRLIGAMAGVPAWNEQGVNAVFANWRGIVGPRGLTSQQVAYWDAVIAKLVKSDDWLREVEKRGWEPDYLNSNDSRRFLERQNEELKSLLGELGLAKS
jgi:putative tricarboxylic transport membrane protein